MTSMLKYVKIQIVFEKSKIVKKDRICKLIKHRTLYYLIRIQKIAKDFALFRRPCTTLK